MNKQILLAGGCLRPNGFELGEGKYYHSARLVKLDTVTGQFEVVLQKDEGGENYPSEHPNLQFTCCWIDGDDLWLPTDTEVLQYSLPDLTLIKSISYPCFHNIHSVALINGELAITSTGLDNVVICDPQSGEIKQILNTQGKDPWHRFDKETDYRQLYSTRPHDSHPNHVFEMEGDLWVTRCTQEDAVNLSNVEDRISITEDHRTSVHDGHLYNGQLIFTRVDGMLAICDPKTRKLVERFDPFEKEANRPMGWCRGLYIDGDDFYIGYSKLRKTSMKSRLKFLTQGNFKYASGNNALVVKVNMQTRKVEKTYTTPDGMIDAIYGIVPYNYG